MDIEIPTASETYKVPSPRQVKALRAYLGMSQGDFARRANTSSSTIVDYELGRRAQTQATLRALALCAHSLEVHFNDDGSIVLPE